MTTRTLTLLVFAACALAQPKPTLTPADCGKWETLGAGALSPDGKWLAYEIRRTSGNHELRVAATAGGGKTHVLAFCSGAAFSADSRYLACSATVSEAEQDRARKAGRPVQDKLNVLDLGSGEIAKVDDVQSLAFSGVGPYLAFRKYPPAGAGRGGDEAAPAAGGGRGGRGYATLHDGKTERAVFLDKGVSGLEKAKDADTFIYQSGAWDDSPNFFAAGADLKNATRVSDTNPFASQYAWGRAELIDYQNSHGDRLQGALYYPAPYEKGKQYPLIVQIYEIESNQLHNWTAPSERATYNAAVWTQHGYFVLRPDIVFKARDPGVSALDCVTAAVKKTLESGMIDARRVGLTGHSWGGYETTFIVTHSDLFAAGVVGGALTNLSSSVGEIYWNTGAPETNHVEVSQERMQVPLYEDPQSYIRNSATFVANKLAAPLLMEVGDHDGLVRSLPERRARRRLDDQGCHRPGAGAGAEGAIVRWGRRSPFVVCQRPPPKAIPHSYASGAGSNRTSRTLAASCAGENGLGR